MLNFSPKLKLFAFGKWPTGAQWGQFFNILTKKEKIFFSVFLTLLLASSISLFTNFYFKNTEIRPAKGGVFSEGVVGQPRFINPIYVSSNDVDRDLMELLFSGIMKYDENGALVYDLAKDIKTENDGKTYRVFLKDDVLWQDSGSGALTQKLTADDVIFTIKTIQNQDYKSPLRVNWLGVEAEKINDFEITFLLKNSYSAFLENLTFKILPSHIWQKISVQNFPLSDYNLKPVGSGPYQFKSISRDGSGHVNSLVLEVNQKYYGKRPYLQEISFKFFESEKDLVASANNGRIDGFSLSAAGNEAFAEKSSFESYSFLMPRYFAIFFNAANSKALSDLKVRQALNFGTNKDDLIEKALNSKAEIVDSPILPNIYGFELPAKIYQFDKEKAKSLLDEAGFKETESGVREKIINKEPAFRFKSKLQIGSTGTEVTELQKCLAKYPDIYPSGQITGTFGSKTKAAVILFQEKYASEVLKPGGLTKGTGTVLSYTRKKLNELCAPATEEKIILKIKLATVDQAMLINTANILKQQWREIGVEIEIATSTSSDLENNIIKPRDYEMLLFGEALGGIPDPFPFWDSIQKKDPGLNLSAYDNKNADKLLEEARQTLDMAERQKKLEKFQDILIGDAPCVFLYSPDYVYFVSGKIKGIKEKMITDPSKRFTNIENWHIRTSRHFVSREP
ncbi:MAG: ABC transporter substrate-binding protein [Patescibacteria group bacterium]